MASGSMNRPVAWLCVALLVCVAPAFGQVALERSVSGTGEYIPGSTLDITITFSWGIEYELTAIGLEETLPEGWRFVEVIAGETPAIAMENSEGILEFAWFSYPMILPEGFTYRVAVPEEAVGEQILSGACLYRVKDLEGEQQTVLDTVIPQWGPHTFYVDAGADAGGDGSAAFPFKTLAAAAEAAVATREDVILIGPGAYAENGFALPASTRLRGVEDAYDTLIYVSDAESIQLAEGCEVRRCKVGHGGVAVLAGAGVIVENCVFHESAIGIGLGEDAVLSLSNVTFYQQSAAGIRMEAGASLTLHNCIFSGAETGIDASSGAAVTGDYLLFYDTQQQTIPAIAFDTVVVADPRFVDPDALNFHLLSDSAARNAGHPDAVWFNRDGGRNDLGADGGPLGDLDEDAPAARFSTFPEAAEIDAGTTVYFNAAESWDEWGIAAYAWDFDASDGFEAEAYGVAPSHYFDAPGLFTVTLRVTDQRGHTADANWQVAVAKTTAVLSGVVRDSLGNPMAGVQLVATPSGSKATATSDAAGAYSLMLPLGFSGVVAAQYAGYSFEPAAWALEALEEDQGDLDFVGTAICPALDAPLDVRASDGASSSLVVIQWSAVANATGYRIERSMTADFGEFIVLGERTGTEYRDATALAPDIGQAGWGCWKEEVVTPQVYYYRVISLSDCTESAASVPDDGYVGAAKFFAAAMGDLLLVLLVLLVLSLSFSAFQQTGFLRSER